jgi:hypothetical protein
MTLHIVVFTRLLTSVTRDPTCATLHLAPTTHRSVDLTLCPTTMNVRFVETTRHIESVTLRIAVMAHRPMVVTRQPNDTTRVNARTTRHIVDNTLQNADLTLHIVKVVNAQFPNRRKIGNSKREYRRSNRSSSVPWQRRRRQKEKLPANTPHGSHRFHPFIAEFDTVGNAPQAFRQRGWVATRRMETRGYRTGRAATIQTPLLMLPRRLSLVEKGL